MNQDDLWIGDNLRIKSTGELAKYDGAVGRDKAKVLIHGAPRVVALSDLELYEDQPSDYAMESLQQSLGKKKLEKTDVPSEIDLHIEKLAPHMLNQSLARILDFQLEKAEEYIHKAIEARKYRVTIIHGKGSGTLKQSVLHMLRGIAKVQFAIDANDGGATEVWLSL